MFIRKAQAGSAPGYTWTRDGQVLEVDDWIAEQLLDIPRGGFSIAEAPEPEPELDQQDAAEEDVHEEDAEDQPKRKGGRPKLPRDTEGNIIRTEVAE